MAFRMISREVVNLTPKLAKRYQSGLERVRGERDLQKNRCTYLLRRIAVDDFWPPMFGEATCKEDGLTYRVNGQHCSTVLVACDSKSEDLDLRLMCSLRRQDEWPKFPSSDCSIDRWECEKLDELKRIFDYYDNPISVRKAGDKLGIYVGEYDELQHLDVKFAKQILAGVALVAAHRAARSELLLGEAVTRENLPSIRDRGEFLAYDGVRDYVLWAIENLTDVDLVARSTESRFVFDNYITDGPELTAETLRKLFQQDEDEEGPGHDMFNQIRAWIAKGTKKLKPATRLSKLQKHWDAVKESRELVAN